MASRNRFAFARRISAVVCLLAVSGCFDNGITWLPDSSGFIYTGSGEPGLRKVHHFELATRKVRVVVEDTKALTYWPAISPDGKQIAVARVLYWVDEKACSLQISRYGLNGKELHRSPALPWHFRHTIGTALGDGQWEGRTSLFWSPQGDKLIVTDSVEQIPAGTAIYDIAKERLTPLKGHVLVIGGTPIRRDGKVFLMWNYDGIFLVTMNGEQERIGVLEEGKRAILRLDQSTVTRWEGDTAVVAGATAEVRIDTVKRSLTFTEMVPPRAAAEYAFPDNGAVVRGGGIEILKPGAPRPHTVSKSGQYLFVPSPDQKWLALRGMSRGSKILVIDRRGDVVAELPQ